MNCITFGLKKNPAVLFLHGWGGSVDSWVYYAKNFAHFGFFCVVVDFPGFGKSKEPEAAYSVGDYAQEVENLIAELGLNSVSVIGHSFGGRVAIMLASNKKIKVDKLVLVDSAGVIPRRGFGYFVKVKRYKRLKRQVQEGRLPKEVLNNFGSEDYRCLSDVMKATFVKVVNEDLLVHAKNIDCETILIWGKFDKDTPLYMAKKLNRAIKDSRLVVLPAGHYSYLEQVEPFIDEVYAFLIS